jgi:hypothetical protein
MTPASGLLQKIWVILTWSDCLKCSTIFSAFEPEPEAKMTIFFTGANFIFANLRLIQEPFGICRSFVCV